MNERNKERKNATLSPNRRIPKSDSYEKVRSSSGQGDIHKLRRQAGGGGLSKCLCYYISLCIKLAYGGGGIKNWRNQAYVVYGCSLGAMYYNIKAGISLAFLIQS